MTTDAGLPSSSGSGKAYSEENGSAWPAASSAGGSSASGNKRPAKERVRHGGEKRRHSDVVGKGNRRESKRRGKEKGKGRQRSERMGVVGSQEWKAAERIGCQGEGGG